MTTPPGVHEAELAQASGGTILEIRGNESHSGSASEFSKRWETSGGGALLRLGIHPISAAIYLKQREGRRQGGNPRRVASVWAQTADLTRVAGFDPATARVVSGWVDVENWATGVLTFDDGSTAVITASDISLGGANSWMELFLEGRWVVRARRRDPFGVLRPIGAVAAHEGGGIAGVMLSRGISKEERCP